MGFRGRGRKSRSLVCEQIPAASAALPLACAGAINRASMTLACRPARGDRNGVASMLTGESFRLDGKVALITGSGRNIGRAVAEAFAAAGAKVVVNGHRDSAALDEVVAGIRARGGEALPVLADVADDAEVA